MTPKMNTGISDELGAHAQQFERVLHLGQAATQFIDAAEDRLQRCGHAQKNNQNCGQLRQRLPQTFAITTQQRWRQSNDKQNRNSRRLNYKSRNIRKKTREAIVTLGKNTFRGKSIDKITM